jgi:hypothetical protein
MIGTSREVMAFDRGVSGPFSSVIGRTVMAGYCSHMSLR